MRFPSELWRLVRGALVEDGFRRDITSWSIAAGQRARGEIVAEQKMVVSGVTAAIVAFRLCDGRAVVRARLKDGATARPGQVILEVRCRARAMLTAERTALNFLGHLSGVATLTRLHVAAIPSGCRAKILDTRKTTPLLRSLEKDAVRHGGGVNHRRSLSDAVLLKDNHIMMAGGIIPAIRSLRRRLGNSTRIEVEASTIKQVRDGLSSGADIILLDNMTDARIRRAVRECRGRAKLEVSGGVSIDRIPGLARTGVDCISVGALTHSAPSAKLSMDIYPVRSRR